MVRGVHLRKDLGEQSIPRHRVKNARLPHEHHQYHRRQASHRTDVHQVLQPLELRHRLKRRRHWMRHPQRLIGGQTGHDQRHQDVEHRADQQRRDHTDGQIALRIFCFLCRCGHRIEADVREEHHRRSAQNPRHAILGAAIGIRDHVRNERMPVVGIHIRKAEADHQQHDRHFDGDHDVVERGRLLHTTHQQHGEGKNQENRGEIDQAVHHVTTGGRTGITRGKGHLGCRIGQHATAGGINAGKRAHHLMPIHNGERR